MRLARYLVLAAVLVATLPCAFARGSVDPVAADPEGGSNFNRYAYAYNNPYRYTDPDRRLGVDAVIDAGFTLYDGARFLGATAAWIHGKASGNQALANEGWQGMKATGGDVAVSAGTVIIPGISAPLVRGAGQAGDVGQVIYRHGNSRETATRLQRKASEAENSPAGIHGVSSSTTKPDGPCSSATCAELEAAGFKVHDTPSKRDRNHKTIELPSPVTKEDADRFNQVLGR